MRSLGLTDFGHYLNLLESNQHSGEWQAFINSLTTNLTAFFREAHHFPLLADHARRRSGEYRVLERGGFDRRRAVQHCDDAG
ncbi:hypothetical protein ACLK1X_10780 [Escherichia coli]